MEGGGSLAERTKKVRCIVDYMALAHKKQTVESHVERWHVMAAVHVDHAIKYPRKAYDCYHSYSYYYLCYAYYY